MSVSTPIQWTDDSVNPVMGCSAPCELRPTPAQAREIASKFFVPLFPDADPEKITALVKDELGSHNATEIYQLRDCTVEAIFKALRARRAKDMRQAKIAYKAALDEKYICYAHWLHIVRGTDITFPDKIINQGFALQFEVLKKFPGRMAKAAMSPDLCLKPRRKKPWLNYLPRTFFVSDMADALSEEIDFVYLKQEIIDVASSARGRQHLWFWLTKMPYRMAEFATWLKGMNLSWPDNLVAMTSISSRKTVVRARQLLAVPARLRGLSVEPLWEDVTLPLEKIDWCIVGGQSGPGSKPFDVAWIRSLRTQCQESKTALFVKQLGKNPMSENKPLALKDVHGGNWLEWPAEFRIRDVPPGFHTLRKLA